MMIPVELVPQEFIDANKVASKIKNGYMYINIVRRLYGHPQVGVIDNKLLETCLKEQDYYKLITLWDLFHTILYQYSLH